MNYYKKNNELIKKIDKLNFTLRKNNVLDLINLMGNRKQIFIRNFFSGVFRGIGIGIGFTLITAIIVLILRKIVALNLPVIGEFVADLVDIVKYNRKF